MGQMFYYLTTEHYNGNMYNVDKMAMISFYRYRQLTNSEEIEVEGLCPKFGIYIGLNKTGRVAVGDPVYVNVE